MAKAVITRTVTQTIEVESISENYFDEEKARNMTPVEVVEYELSLDLSDYAESMFDKDPETEEVTVSIVDDNDNLLHQAKKIIERHDDGSVHTQTASHNVKSHKR